MDDIRMRRIADHLRASRCSASRTGPCPSNEKQGYVVRKVLQPGHHGRASNLGLQDRFLPSPGDPGGPDRMGKAYP